MTRKDQEVQIYEILLSQFAVAQGRTEYLTDKAHSLLGFAGVINSILVALIVFMVKDESTRNLLYSSPFFTYIRIVVFSGFSFYIISTVSALLSFKIRRYKRAPSIQSLEFIQGVSKGTAKLSIPHMSVQIFDAIQFTDETNKKKYKFLLAATGLLLLAIVCTAIMGALIFGSI
jgi:hypothetical protein